MVTLAPQVDASLLKYMSRYVRVKGDITHQEYKVVGINWDSSRLILSGDKGFFQVHHSKCDLIPEETEDW